MNNYHVKYTRNEDGSWTAQAVELPAAITQGRSIEQARTRLREAIQAVLDLRKPFSGELVDEVQIPAPIARSVRAAREAKAASEASERDASAKARKAVAALKDWGLSVRDAGELLKISGQRVQQLARK